MNKKLVTVLAAVFVLAGAAYLNANFYHVESNATDFRFANDEGVSWMPIDTNEEHLDKLYVELEDGVLWNNTYNGCRDNTGMFVAKTVGQPSKEACVDWVK